MATLKHKRLAVVLTCLKAVKARGNAGICAQPGAVINHGITSAACIFVVCSSRCVNNIRLINMVVYLLFTCCAVCCIL